MENKKTFLNKPVLVLGSTGKTGSRIAAKLSAMGIAVREGSRKAKPSFDWLDPTGWATALAGIKAVYISYQPDLAVPGAVDVVTTFIEEAKKAGVSKYVLLSGRGEEEAQQAEEAIRNADVNYTILRASWFSQNFSEGAFIDPILGGYVALPVGDVGEPFIDADDIADAAVAAFTTDIHDYQTYELTGPRLLTFKEAVAEIAKATGKPIQYQQISNTDYTDMMINFGVPPDALALVNYLFKEVLDGRNAYITDDVQRILGRPAKDFTTFATETAARGVWNTTAQPAI